jgi:hypothetical protein
LHNSQLDPKFLTGFVDGEGSFIVGFFANNKYKNGYQIQLIFKISLHNKYFELLSQIQSYFGFTLFFFFCKLFFYFSNHVFRDMILKIKKKI